MLCVFFVTYGALVACVNVFLERKIYGDSRYYVEREKAKAIDTTFCVINFVNALVASVLSSAALVTIGDVERSDVSTKSPGSLADWSVEGVA